ncbi:MAG: hypothetical protein LC795_04935 [Acidobacteria bacterium]|nr:hypothetical protein [Acidobacteriota bacterium]
MKETGHFVNEGFGWECRRCREASGAAAAEQGVEGSPATKASALPRFFREGEAEGGGPRLSTPALARRVAGSRTRLRCPLCGVEEEVTARL